MKNFCLALALSGLILTPALASRPAGFYMPDSVHELTLRYTTVRGLILLPVTINDSIAVNLILDTGCRNLVLFGKQFKDKFTIASSRPIVFSGLGQGNSVTGRLSVGNSVVIDDVVGESIPVVVVEEGNLFSRHKNVHGIVGYELFLRFEIELNPREKTITFRKANAGSSLAGCTLMPLQIVDARPIIKSSVTVNGRQHELDLMIDTGSVLGLLIKTTNLKGFHTPGNEQVVGVGLNGHLFGHRTRSRSLSLPGITLTSVPTAIVSSQWHHNASLGMEVLRDYVVVINYCKGVVGLRRYEGRSTRDEVRGGAWCLAG